MIILGILFGIYCVVCWWITIMAFAMGFMEDEGWKRLLAFLILVPIAPLTMPFELLVAWIKN